MLLASEFGSHSRKDESDAKRPRCRGAAAAGKPPTHLLSTSQTDQRNEIATPYAPRL